MKDDEPVLATSHVELAFNEDNQLILRAKFENDQLHGISVDIDPETQTRTFTYFSRGVDVTDEISEHVNDISNLTEEDKTYIKIKYDIDLGS